MNAKYAKALSGLGVLVAIVMLVAMFPATNAQTTSPGFGTKVKYGDNDFIPTMASAAGLSDADLVMIDFGVPSDVNDNCFYLDADGGGTVEENDVRLVVSSGCTGKTVGSLVSAADAAEKILGTLIGATFQSQVRYGDANSNSRYDVNDCVYVTTHATGLDVATSSTAMSIRLTPCGEGTALKAAGTLVKAEDADYIRFQTSTSALAGATVGVFNKDLSAAGTNTIFSAGDRLYITNGAPVGGSFLIPLYSIRLVGDTGQFGSQVKLGEVDFLPTIDNLFTAATAEVARVDFGSDGDVNNDCFYLVFDGSVEGAGPDAGAIDENSVRLVAQNNCSEPTARTAGSLVGVSDSPETGAASEEIEGAAASNFQGGIRFGDEDQSGRYDMGDCLYFTTDAAGLDASTSRTSLSIRLTSCKGKPAGTLVFSGDTDFTSYQSNTLNTGVTATRLALFNKDRSTGATEPQPMTSGDLLWLTRSAVSVGDLLPLYSIRLLGSADTGAFGTQVKFGDRDFVPTLLAGVDLTTNLGIDVDGTSAVTTDCYFLNMDGSGTSINTNDVRLRDCSLSGKKAGTLVVGGDASERVASSSSPAVRVAYADVGGSGRYDEPDYVYLTTGTGTACATTASTASTIRLTAAGTNYAAGSLAFSGDTDFSAYGASGCAVLQASGDDVIAVFDADLSGAFTAGDRAYISRGVPAAGSLVTLYSVRLVGDFSQLIGLPTGSVSSSASSASASSASSVSSSSVSSSVSKASSPSSSPASSPGKSTKTPGFEAVIAIATVAAAISVVAWRRK